MLPKSLLKFRRSGEQLKPVFIDAEDDDNIQLARELLELYRIPENSADALTRGELEEMAEPLLKGHRDRKLACGLHKLALDRCEFSVPPDIDYRELRSKLFVAGASLLLEGEPPEDSHDYRSELLRRCSCADNEIYYDLPHNEKLCKVRELFPRELLQRWNCSQVQSLLLYASAITLNIEEPNPAAVRKLFKYMKFFRLLAEIQPLAEKKKKSNTDTMFRFTMKISGPISLFENTRKYALQLASFFPAICDLKKWNINAEIKIDDRQYQLKLNQDAGLVGHYRNFSSYIPEEITMFHRLFREKSESWEIIGESPFFHFTNQELIFPDLSFRSKLDGRTVHLELFHRWHSTPLLRRLQALDDHPDVALLIGVDRSLSARPEIKYALDHSTFFQRMGFLFRDFPGVERVTRVLNKLG